MVQAIEVREGERKEFGSGCWLDPCTLANCAGGANDSSAVTLIYNLVSRHKRDSNLFKQLIIYNEI